MDPSRLPPPPPPVNVIDPKVVAQWMDRVEEHVGATRSYLRAIALLALLQVVAVGLLVAKANGWM